MRLTAALSGDLRRLLADEVRAAETAVTAGVRQAQAAARRAVEAIERQARERSDAGLPLDGVPDLQEESERDGLFQAQLIRGLAHHGLERRGARGRTGAADAREDRRRDGALPSG